MGLFGPPDVEKLEAKRDVPGLIKALGYEKDWRVRRAAAEALGLIGGTGVVEPVIAALSDPDVLVQQAATKTLGQIGDPLAVPALARALCGRFGTAAADALGQIADSGAAEALVNAIASSSSVDMRHAAAEGLVKIGSPAVKPLTSALGSADSITRQTAVVVLGRIGWTPDSSYAGAVYLVARCEWGKCVGIGAAAVEPLIAALGNENASVRKAAAEALVEIGAAAVEPLIAALASPDKNVRKGAADVLDRFGWRPDMAEAGAFYWIATGEWGKCVQIGAPAVEPLIAALGDENEGVRKAAAEALGQIGDARAVEPLVAALADRKWDDDVGKAAAAALSAIADPGAVGPLLDALEDPRAKRNAVEVLGHIHDARAVGPLLAALDSGDSEGRRAAARALVAIYQSGVLGPEERALLLKQPSVVTPPHEDSHMDVGHDDHGYHIDVHDDATIRVHFPV